MKKYLSLILAAMFICSTAFAVQVEELATNQESFLTEPGYLESVLEKGEHLNRFNYLLDQESSVFISEKKLLQVLLDELEILINLHTAKPIIEDCKKKLIAWHNNQPGRLIEFRQYLISKKYDFREILEKEVRRHIDLFRQLPSADDAETLEKLLKDLRSLSSCCGSPADSRHSACPGSSSTTPQP